MVYEWLLVEAFQNVFSLDISFITITIFGSQFHRAPSVLSENLSMHGNSWDTIYKCSGSLKWVWLMGFTNGPLYIFLLSNFYFILFSQMLQTWIIYFVKNKTTKWNDKMQKHIQPKNKITPSLPSHLDQQDYIKQVYLCKILFHCKMMTVQIICLSLSANRPYNNIFLFRSMQSCYGLF